jgi:uncharacterized membrane protein YphA (DoxX/SURF4 family)
VRHEQRADEEGARMEAKEEQTRRRWTLALWAGQILLAAIYAMAGFLKVSQPVEALAAMGMTYAVDFPAELTRFVGSVELLGAVGILVPAALRILPILTILAALGFCLIQVLAMGMHTLRGEITVLPINVVLFALSAFVLWGRLVKAPIRGRKLGD